METPSTSPWAQVPWGIKVILFDLWKTIARGPYPEPITNFRILLGLDGKVNNEDFLRVCLTTDEEDPQLYMQRVAARYGLFDLPADALEKFQTLIRTEKNGLLTYNDLGEGNRALWDLRPGIQARSGHQLVALPDQLTSQGHRAGPGVRACHRFGDGLLRQAGRSAHLHRCGQPVRRSSQRVLHGGR